MEKLLKFVLKNWMPDLQDEFNHLICLPGLSYAQAKPQADSQSNLKHILAESLSFASLAIKEHETTNKRFCNDPYLHNLFAPNQDGDYLPLANYLLSETLKQKFLKKYSWVYLVSPVNLHVDINAIILRHDLSFDLSEQNYQLLTDYLNNYFCETEEDKSWEIFYDININQLFLFSKDNIKYNQVSVIELIGQNINNHELIQLPPQWKQTITEIQMHLQQFPLNHEFAQQAKPMINSLWFDSGGKISIQNEHQFNPFHFHQIITDDIKIEAICKQQNLSYQRLHDIENYHIDFNIKTMVYITSLIKSVRVNDAGLFYQLIDNLVLNITKPIAQHIKTKSEPLLLVTDQHAFVLRKHSFANQLIVLLKKLLHVKGTN